MLVCPLLVKLPPEVVTYAYSLVNTKNIPGLSCYLPNYSSSPTIPVCPQPIEQRNAGVFLVRLGLRLGTFATIKTRTANSNSRFILMRLWQVCIMSLPLGHYHFLGILAGELHWCRRLWLYAWWQWSRDSGDEIETERLMTKKRKEY